MSYLHYFPIAFKLPSKGEETTVIIYKSRY